MYDQVGSTAGKVYEKLGAQGQMSMSRLKKEVGETDTLVAMAVGWLAREGKINLNKERNTLKVTLSSN